MAEILHALIPFAVFGFPAAVLVSFRLIKHRERMASVGDSRQAAALEARLAAMQQQLDAVAVEMERVSEGQRFVTRLLAERAPAAAPGTSAGQRERALTPR